MRRTDATDSRAPPGQQTIARTIDLVHGRPGSVGSPRSFSVVVWGCQLVLRRAETAQGGDLTVACRSVAMSVVVVVGELEESGVASSRQLSRPGHRESGVREAV